MGMESYFLKLQPSEASQHECISKDTLVQRMVNHGLILRQLGQDYLLDQAFIVRAADVNDCWSEISLEGCFSWFEESLSRCFDMIQIVNSEITEVQIFQPDNVLIPMSKEIFMDKSKKFYSDKFRQFQLRYGDMNVKLSPDKPFYDYVKKLGKRTLLQKLFGK